MINKFKIKRIIASGLMLAMCGFPITGCGKNDREIDKNPTKFEFDINKDNSLMIDYFLEDPGPKIYDVGEHYFYSYAIRPSNNTPDAEGSFMLNVPEGYEVYDYETLSGYRIPDTIKVTFVNVKPVYVESVRHEDTGYYDQKYYYWDYCYPGKVTELENEKPLEKTKTINK
jgi:hypothetical protein